MKSSVNYARQSDPDFNRQFARRWSEPTKPVARPRAEAIKLIEIPLAAGADGSPRAALLVPPMPAALDRRPVRRIFDSIGDAIAAKRMLEAAR
ncbi:hypothetical protein BKE38_22400 [Pseudoroseomonas deserti]|uniref:Uncharacterized protein n=1 Tax=Teichococcus deserti TaxID=1817963 RepID=A0A1V2GXD2_9PROT|nr:hypothetical protein [Pseudoroseomonas deserti]ONG47972.1 hypothetical protein BKE38_22400 [Pseudoroseomonas deserti]